MNIRDYLRWIIIFFPVVLSPSIFANSNHIITLMPLKGLDTYTQYKFASSEFENIIIATPQKGIGFKRRINQDSEWESLGTHYHWHQIQFSPDKTGEVIAIQDANGDARLVKSFDDGTTWDAIATNCLLGSNGKWSKIQFIPHTTQILFFSRSEQKLYTSSDGGKTCTNAEQLPNGNLGLLVSPDGSSMYAMNWDSLNIYHSNESHVWHLLSGIKIHYQCEPAAIDQSNTAYFFDNNSNKPLINYTSDSGSNWSTAKTQYIDSILKLISVGSDSSLFALDIFNKFWFHSSQDSLSIFHPLHIDLKDNATIPEEGWSLVQLITTNHEHTEGMVTFSDYLQEQNNHSKRISYMFKLN